MTLLVEHSHVSNENVCILYVMQDMLVEHSHVSHENACILYVMQDMLVEHSHVSRSDEEELGGIIL
jgi:hypothetical protein